MNQATLLLIQFAIKFGLDAAIAMAKAMQSGATIDDAIAALEIAQGKTAQDYLNEAKSTQSPPPVP